MVASTMLLVNSHHNDGFCFCHSDDYFLYHRNMTCYTMVMGVTYHGGDRYLCRVDFFSYLYHGYGCYSYHGCSLRHGDGYDLYHNDYCYLYYGDGCDLYVTMTVTFNIVAVVSW